MSFLTHHNPTICCLNSFPCWMLQMLFVTHAHTHMHAPLYAAMGSWPSCPSSWVGWTHCWLAVGKRTSVDDHLTVLPNDRPIYHYAFDSGPENIWRIIPLPPGWGTVGGVWVSGEFSDVHVCCCCYCFLFQFSVTHLTQKPLTNLQWMVVCKTSSEIFPVVQEYIQHTCTTGLFVFLN